MTGAAGSHVETARLRWRAPLLFNLVGKLFSASRDLSPLIIVGVGWKLDQVVLAGMVGLLIGSSAMAVSGPICLPLFAARDGRSSRVPYLFVLVFCSIGAGAVLALPMVKQLIGATQGGLQEFNTLYALGVMAGVLQAISSILSARLIVKDQYLGLAAPFFAGLCMPIFLLSSTSIVAVGLALLCGVALDIVVLSLVLFHRREKINVSNVVVPTSSQYQFLIVGQILTFVIIFADRSMLARSTVGAVGAAAFASRIVSAIASLLAGSLEPQIITRIASRAAGSALLVVRLSRAAIATGGVGVFAVGAALVWMEISPPALFWGALVLFLLAAPAIVVLRLTRATILGQQLFRKDLSLTAIGGIVTVALGAIGLAASSEWVLLGAVPMSASLLAVVAGRRCLVAAKNSSGPPDGGIDGSGRLVMYSDMLSGANGAYSAAVSSALRASGIECECVSPYATPTYSAIPNFEFHFLRKGPTGFVTYVPPVVLRSLSFLAFWLRTNMPQLLVVVYSTHLEAALLYPALRLRRPPAGACLVVHDPEPHRWFFSKRLRRLERALMHATWRRYDRIVVHDQIGADVIAASGVARSRIVVAALPPLRRPISSEPVVRRGVCLVGVMRPDKDYRSVVRAYQMLSAEVRGEHPLLIAGRPQSDFDLTGLLQIVEADPLGISVSTGFLDRLELDRVLSGYAVSVVPYLNPTSSSAVALEASAFGCRVMVPNEGSLSHLVANGIAVEWPITPMGRLAALQFALTEPTDSEVLVSKSYPDFDTIAKSILGTNEWVISE